MIGVPTHLLSTFLSILSAAIVTEGLISLRFIAKISTLERWRLQLSSIDQQHDFSINRDDTIPEEISWEIRSIAEILWDSGSEEESLGEVAMIQGYGDSLSDGTSIIMCKSQNQGEMPLPKSIPISQRYAYFLKHAKMGEPRAQHSAGLLLWNGFCTSSSSSPTAEEMTMDDAMTIDPEASARWHAAAAIQGNMDALAVLGGCLRTGTGVGKCKNIALGLRCIEYAASAGNPSGANKKAAMMEMNGDYIGAMRLYQECYDDGRKRANALLLFNLGYCLVHGDGIDYDIEKGEQLWRDAVELAPDEGSEEAAWFLYQQYTARDDDEMARYYLTIAADLGHQDAGIQKQKDSELLM